MCPETPESRITSLLQAWRDGDATAPGKLMPLVYDELRRIARRYMAREKSGHLLQTTALVNEAYLRVVPQQAGGWQDRVHFFAIAAQMMRRVLVDQARQRGRAKRGGSMDRVTLSEGDVAISHKGIDVMALDQALSKLASFDARKSQLVELRYFGGLNVKEIAEALGVSPITVKRDWATAKAWLYNALRKSEAD